MDIAVVDPELRAATAKQVVLNPRNGVLRALAALGLRLLPTRGNAEVSVERVGSGAAEGLLYRPATPRSDGALLWIHGGGFVIGAPQQDHPYCLETAERLGLTVLSAGYRLSPRHPFPAALDDLTAAWRWLQDHARELGVDPARIVIGGESAGGGLAATLVQRLHDASGVHPLGQLLFCPMLDDRTATRTDLSETRHFIWDADANRFGWASYLGRPPGASDLPSYAAGSRREDLTGLPPAYVTTGDIELFHDEDVAYAERLRAAGVDAVLDVVPGAPHGFENWARSTPPARALLERTWAWLGTTLGVAVAPPA